MAVITIAREFGAGGSSVATMLAEKLGAELVDRQLAAEVARLMGLPAERVAAEEERARSVVDRLIRSSAWAGSVYAAGGDLSFGGLLADPQQAVRTLTEEVIRDSARRGNAIIVGRAGATVLADWPGAVHVFLHAAEPARIRQIMTRLALTEEEARRRVRQVDADRAAYSRQNYGADWRSPRLYDVIIDTGRLGYERTVETILAALGSGSA
jgi:cytidylate kinase